MGGIGAGKGFYVLFHNPRMNQRKSGRIVEKNGI